MSRRIEPAEKRARLRAVAARRIAGHGLAGFNLHRLAPEAGIGFDLARHYYRTNEALIGDVVRWHHAALGERMADAVLAARGLAGPARAAALARALLEALAAAADGHRACLAAIAALPGVAEAARHADAWLEAEFAACFPGPDALVWGRSAMVLLGYWGARLEAGDAPEDAAARAACAGVVAGRVGGGVPKEHKVTNPLVRSGQMESVSLAAAKTRLSELVERAASGEPVRITRRGKPVARIVPIEAPRRRIDPSVLRALTDAMTVEDEAGLVRRMRDEDRY